jgi:hypothetical protein
MAAECTKCGHRVQSYGADAMCLLSELCAAARATVAGQGSPASLALLREVLAKHGWLPPPGATPLQMLAAGFPLRLATPGRRPLPASKPS